MALNNGKCVVCGKNISGMFYTTDRNQKFCGHHPDPVRCRHCLMILAKGEGMPCNTCQVKGYKNSSDAASSIQKVLTWLETEIGSHSFGTVPVQMDDGANFLPQQGGVTNWRYDGYKLDVEVRMLQFSQVHIFEPTLAHEYGHVLLVADPMNLSFTGGLSPNRLQEEEGFCEVLRYLWVTQASTGHRDLELQAISENQDPVYGDGFRLMWPRYKAAGSIMNLRNELLGLIPIAQPAQPVKPSWPFGKKKKAQPSSPTPIPQTQPQVQPPQTLPTHVAPVAPGTVIEGGSHRPTLNLDFLQTPSPAVTPSAPVQPAASRPSIDISGVPPASPSPAPQTNTSQSRPTIKFGE